MSYTISHRASSFPKHVLRSLQEKTDQSSVELRDSKVTESIKKTNKELFDNMEKATVNIDACKVAQKTSYLNNYAVLFKNLMMWPFIPNLSKAEKVNAYGRLTLFGGVCIFIFLITNALVPPSLQ